MRGSAAGGVADDALEDRIELARHLVEGFAAIGREHGGSDLPQSATLGCSGCGKLMRVKK